jgi:6-phosphogluconolactonase
MANEASGRTVVFVSLTGDEVIKTYDLESETGGLTLRATSPAHGPSGALCLHPNRTVMYDAHVESTTLACFDLDEDTGQLGLINKVDTGIAIPAHLMVDLTGKFLLTAYYGGGGVTVHRLAENGAILELVQYVDTGEKAHAILSTDGDSFVFVPHVCPTNRTNQFRFDADSGLLSPNDPSYLTPPDGQTGPRHICFNRNGDVAYIVNEQGNTVTAHHYDAERGTLEIFQNISTLPNDYLDGGATAHVEIHPNGKWLYASNRGHDSVVAFDIAADATLSQSGHVSVPASPRSFSIDPTGKYLYCAGEEAGTMNSYQIDASDGSLKYLTEYEVGAKPFWVMATRLG